jgi:hypothetical protein
MMLPSGTSGMEKRERMAIMEAAISSSLSHPNVVQVDQGRGGVLNYVDQRMFYGFLLFHVYRVHVLHHTHSLSLPRQQVSAWGMGNTLPD